LNINLKHENSTIFYMVNAVRTRGS